MESVDVMVKVLPVSNSGSVPVPKSKITKKKKAATPTTKLPNPITGPTDASAGTYGVWVVVF